MTHGQRRGISRRQILRGIGGFALALPFLPSLAEERALADAAPARPRLFWLGTDHGGAFDTNMFPATSMLTKSATALSGHTVMSGALSAPAQGGTTALSPILSASASTLTPALMAKMNVLRGLDVPFYIAHNTGLHLGNYARNDGNGDDGTAVTNLGARPTIDQIMANSSSFYTAADLAGVKARSMIIKDRQLSWTFSNPSQGIQSSVQNVQGTNSSLQLFNSLFDTGAAATPKTRPPIVDKVLASYNSLRQSNMRLSAADKTRLDTHIAMLAELQTTLNARVSCTLPAKPTDDADLHQDMLSKADAAIEGRLWADVVAAAFACDASRIAVYGHGDTQRFSDYMGNDWHQDVAHQWFLSQPQGWLSQSYQGVFEQILLYLAAKLDGMDDGNGKTVLDNSLLAWSQECCMATHDSYGIPVVTFGSAAGYFNTGLYCDYRKSNETAAQITPDAQNVPGYTTNCGLLYSQWLANVLLSMGIAPSEFELWSGEKGYGTPYLTQDTWTPPYTAHYQSLTSQYFTMASDPLPFLKA